MAVLLFANNASSIVASPINAAALSVTVADASTYPVPAANQYFIATFVDAATGLIREIVHVTAVTGNDLTIVRAQEGTTARSWNVGDVVANFWTAGAASAMLQQGQDQLQASNYAVDTGAANSMVIALSPAPTALSSLVGTPIRVKINLTTTDPSITLNVNGLGASTVRLLDGSLPTVGFFIAGSTWEFMWNGFFFQPVNVVPYTTAGFAASTPFAVGANTGNYQKFPSGLIIQFGNFTSTTGFQELLTLPTAFQNRQFCSVATSVQTNVLTSALPTVITMNPNTAAPVSQNRVTMSFWNGSTFVNGATTNMSWICMGY